MDDMAGAKSRFGDSATCGVFVSPIARSTRPALQQFASIIRDQEAWRGYVVTTSIFSRDATEYAEQHPSIVLIDIDALVQWHQVGLTF